MFNISEGMREILIEGKEREGREDDYFNEIYVWFKREKEREKKKFN